MNILFNYRPGGRIITTESGDKKLMVIRRGPRGIVAMVLGHGPVVIWTDDIADKHIKDSESKLIQKTIDVLNG
jgi:hypothetical protein